jgi:formamidopyrimidine-DNA glycosylase
MPELPEITSRAHEMNKALVGKKIAAVEVLQPKCLNVPARKFESALRGAQIREVTNRGKWIFAETTRGWLLINLGMGGEILLVKGKTLPAKRRLTFRFSDGTALSLNFWWFGYAHYVAAGKLGGHAMTRALGPNAIDLGPEDLRAKIEGRRGGVKAFLLDQNQLAGIGNAYVHDILFLAGLHPQRTLDTLSDSDVRRLAKGIEDGLRPSIKKGGAFYELSLHGKKGGFRKEDILIGYREGEPCPKCRTAIKKIRTGGTSSFICPRCQPLKRKRAR